MPTGIIYLVKNIISNKCYIGQTARTLEIRKTEHFNTTVRIKNNYKFAKALRKYPKESWTWEILAEVEVSELSSFETYFIKDLDTFNKGYNTLPDNNWGGAGNPKYDSTIYELWHPEHGEIRETISELCKRNNSLARKISSLVSGKRQCSYGYVLLKNKDKYNSILKKYSFYHPDYGVITCTALELFNSYPKYFKSGTSNVYGLAYKKVKLSSGWCLAENKEKYNKLIDRAGYLTLTHPEHGTLTLKRSEWGKRFELSPDDTRTLKTKVNKDIRGWKSIVIEL